MKIYKVIVQCQARKNQIYNSLKNKGIDFIDLKEPWTDYLIRSFSSKCHRMRIVRILCSHSDADGSAEGIPQTVVSRQSSVISCQLSVTCHRKERDCALTTDCTLFQERVASRLLTGWHFFIDCFVCRLIGILAMTDKLCFVSTQSIYAIAPTDRIILAASLSLSPNCRSFPLWWNTLPMGFYRMAARATLIIRWAKNRWTIGQSYAP